MHGQHCRLYDESLLKSIMISTGLSVIDYLKETTSENDADLCHYIESNADSIIEQTIQTLSRNGDSDPG